MVPASLRIAEEFATRSCCAPSSGSVLFLFDGGLNQLLLHPLFGRDEVGGVEQAGAVEVGFELVVQLVELGLVVLDVFIRMGGIVLGGQPGGGADFDPQALAGDVVGQL